jgi:hypothetical protein
MKEMNQSKEENSLFEAVTRGRTNRLKFEDRELEQSLLSSLQSIVAKQQEERRITRVWLHFAKDDEKNLLADITLIRWWR